MINGDTFSDMLESDRHHSQAEQFWEDLRQKAVLMVTTDYVLDETITLVRMRANHKKAVQMAQKILASRVVQLQEINREIWNLGWETFQKYKDKKWSFTDCTSFALMEFLGIEKAFAFGRNFQQDGKQLVP